ncbi:putative secreted protein [Streptomyces davaonensis JCM 4913]|uniref:Putative secreted protein n=1 Tax=Streptomyces davaonensis (strain DSM 101723 / JCM 4913 / KCC S-0913 / 768) TaxID=1214101 RepID=K4R759_STRDJ|nr:DUF6344 domain-containing protein [Streptomyces davaonensis]CCK28890.1 putative secreted protein [Streptomyces davaonensis JCM 4913]
MARNKVMTLWTAIVTAFLALCTALGLITSTAAAAVPQTESARNSGSDSDGTEQAAVPALSPWAWAAYARSLPPTMKQRIRAEAHGKTPSCRHRSLTDTEADTEAAPDAGSEAGPAAGSEPGSEALDCGSTTIPAQAKAPATPIPLQR